MANSTFWMKIRYTILKHSPDIPVFAFMINFSSICNTPTLRNIIANDAKTLKMYLIDGPIYFATHRLANARHVLSLHASRAATDLACNADLSELFVAESVTTWKSLLLFDRWPEISCPIISSVSIYLSIYSFRQKSMSHVLLVNKIKDFESS